MHLEVDRTDLHHIRAIAHPSPDLEPGGARIRIDTFGLSANNITYAVYGELMRYWECFPGPAEDGVSWGRVPVWGFGDVVESTSPGLTEGRRRGAGVHAGRFGRPGVLGSGHHTRGGAVGV
jgi:hypothetical protein